MSSSAVKKEGMTPTEWLRSADTGMSSKTIWHHMTSGTLDNCDSPSTPSDAADFGRCHRLLGHFPAWRLRIGEMAHYPGWKHLATNWTALEIMFDMDCMHKDLGQRRSAFYLLLSALLEKK